MVVDKDKHGSSGPRGMNPKGELTPTPSGRGSSTIVTAVPAIVQQEGAVQRDRSPGQLNRFGVSKLSRVT